MVHLPQPSIPKSQNASATSTQQLQNIAKGKLLVPLIDTVDHYNERGVHKRGYKITPELKALSSEIKCHFLK